MAKPTLTAYELNTTYSAYPQEYVSKKVHNQFYNENVLLNHLRKGKKSMPGGHDWHVLVQDGLTAVGDWFVRASTITYTATDPVTKAIYSPVFLREPVVLYEVDLVRAQGAGAVFSYIEQQIDSAKQRLRRKLTTALFATSAETNGVTPISVAIDATGALGGINPATAGQTWWASQETASGSFATRGLDDMRDMWLDVTKFDGMGAPDLILGDDTFVAAYEEAAVGHYDTQSLNRANLGTSGLAFKTAPIERDTNCTSGVVYFLNSNCIQLCEVEGKGLQLKEWVDGRPAGVMGMINDLVWYGQLCTFSRAPLGKLTGVTA